MTEESLFLVGFDEDSQKVFKIPLGVDEGLHGAMEQLFNKAFKKEVGLLVNAKWVCGVPGRDVAVVWGATSCRGMHERYLHVSYSDKRVW